MGRKLLLVGAVLELAAPAEIAQEVGHGAKCRGRGSATILPRWAKLLVREGEGRTRHPLAPRKTLRRKRRVVALQSTASRPQLYRL